MKYCKKLHELIPFVIAIPVLMANNVAVHLQGAGSTDNHWPEDP